MNHFMTLIAFFLVAFVAGAIIRIILKKCSFKLVCAQKYPVRDILLWMFKNGETRKRLLITIGIILFLQLMFFIPLPGIDIGALEELFSSTGQSFDSTTSFLMSGVLSRLAIVSLGLIPFIAACLLLQFASIFIPPLRRLFFGGEAGRDKVNKYTYILAIIIAIIQGVSVSLWLSNPNNFNGVIIVSLPSFIFNVITTLTLTAGVMFLLFSASLINRYGIGNGVPLIIISSILVGVPSVIRHAVLAIKDEQTPAYLTIFWGIIFAAVSYGFFCMTRMVRDFQVKGRGTKGFSIAVRPTIIGIVPLLWALNLISLPAIVFLFRGINPYASGIFAPNSIFYNIAFVLLVFLCTLYILVVFRPKYVGELMKKYGYSLVEARPQSKNFIKEIAKVLAITASLLIGVHFLPRLIFHFFEVPSQTLMQLVCSIDLLIITGVFADIISQLEFFKEKQDLGLGEWSICYIAFDEIEAEVKKEYLKSKGIPALVKPFRYSWGLPIRTVVDQYQIYTPANNSQQARDLILA